MTALSLVENYVKSEKCVHRTRSKDVIFLFKTFPRQRTRSLTKRELVTTPSCVGLFWGFLFFSETTHRQPKPKPTRLCFGDGGTTALLEDADYHSAIINSRARMCSTLAVLKYPFTPDRL